MLTQLQKLSRDVDGRYATDDELRFIVDYLRSYGVRLQTYQRLQQIEPVIVQEVYQKMRAIDPYLFTSSDDDVSVKWKRDTIRVMRYSAVAMLLNDPDALCERLLYWMQTIMRAFGAQKSCKITYGVMQEIVKRHLTPEQASVFCPILAINQHLLGVT
jgi:hypothetical protein